MKVLTWKLQFSIHECPLVTEWVISSINCGTWKTTDLQEMNKWKFNDHTSGYTMWFTAAPKPLKIQVFWVTQPPRVAQPLYSRGHNYTWTCNICTSMIQIGSDGWEKLCTNKQQTNRQTDTTKIMVTWPWTKNAQILYIFVGFVLQRIHCKPYPKDLPNWCHCQLCTDWRNVYVFLDMMLLSMKNKILLKFYVNITVQKLIIKEILLYTMNSFISTSAVTGRAAFWAHQPISITTSPAPPPQI